MNSRNTAGRPIGGPLEYKPADPHAIQLLELVESKRWSGHDGGQTLEAIALELGTTERSLRRWLAEQSRVPRWLRELLDARAAAAAGRRGGKVK